MNDFTRGVYRSEFPDADQGCCMMFQRNSSTSIRYDRKLEISIMQVAGYTRDGEVSGNSSHHYFLYSLRSKIVFEVCLIEWTDTRFGNRFFCWSMAEFSEKFGRPSVFSENPEIRSSLESRRNLRAIIIVLVKSEMDPDNLFMMLSKVMNELHYISDS